MRKGAFLKALRVRGRDLILPGDPERQSRTGMMVMIPFANRIRGGTYRFMGREYRLPVNREGHAIHGLTRDLEWSPLVGSESELTLETLVTHTGYPFTLRAQVTYSLYPYGLSVAILLENQGDLEAPVMIGAHPYFLVSENWSILVEGEIEECLYREGFPTGEFVRSTLSRRDFDSCFRAPREVRLLRGDGGVVIMDRERMDFLQVFTGVRGSVAVEPMTAIPNSFNNGVGLVALKPGSQLSASFSIKFQEST